MGSKSWAGREKRTVAISVTPMNLRGEDTRYISRIHERIEVFSRGYIGDISFLYGVQTPGAMEKKGRGSCSGHCVVLLLVVAFGLVMDSLFW